MLLSSWLGIILIFIIKKSWCIELSEQLASSDKKPRWQFLRLQAEGDITFGSKEPSPSLFKAGSKTYYFVCFFSLFFLGGEFKEKLWRLLVCGPVVVAILTAKQIMQSQIITRWKGWGEKEGGSSIHSITIFGGGVQHYLLNEQSPFSDQITINWPCTATTTKYWKRWSFPICKIVLDHKASLNPIQLNFKCHLQKLNLFNITFLTQGFPKMY